MAYDAATGQLILVAGNPSTAVPTSTWSWDGESWTLLAPVNSPPSRFSPAIAYDPGNSSLVLFGGNGSTGYLDDTWSWDGTTWSQLAPTASPPGREEAALGYDAGTAQLVLYGGYGVAPGDQRATFMSDTWVFDGSSWSQEATTDDPTVPTINQPYGASLSYDSSAGQFVLFLGIGGGSGYGTSGSADTYAWSGSDWSNVTPLRSSPADGYPEALAYDAATSQMIDVTDGQTFSWSDGAWTDLNPPSSPPGHGSLAYDASSRQLIWFEADAFPTDGSSTWGWDGSNWHELSPASSPPLATGAPSLAYDSSTGQLVLYASFQGAGGTYSSETWTWDGDTWSLQTPATSPPALSDASMAYDPISGNLILVGGFTENLPNTVENTTWSWDGTDWSQLSPAASPPPNLDASLAYDPNESQLLLFGGVGCLHGQCPAGSNDTWAWNGSSWAQLSFSEAPAPRGFAGFGWDATSNQMLLTGGSRVDPGLADTWSLTSAAIPVPTITNVVAGYEAATVSWASPAYRNAKDVGSYNVTIAPSHGYEGQPTKTISVAANVHSATFTGLNTIPYSFSVQPISTQGAMPASVPSAPIFADVQAVADQATFVQAACGDGTASLTWDGAVPSRAMAPSQGTTCRTARALRSPSDLMQRQPQSQGLPMMVK
jgi:hypothetical protein